MRLLAEKNEELLQELTELKVLRKNVQELLAESESFAGERRQWALRTDEEVASVRRSAENEAAALRLTCTEETRRIAAQAEQEKEQLRQALSAIEGRVRIAEAARHEAEQRVAQLSVQLGESAKKIAAERASSTAQQTRNLALIEQFRGELDDLRRLRMKDNESWDEEKQLLAAKLRFVEENLLLLEKSAENVRQTCSH